MKDWLKFCYLLFIPFSILIAVAGELLVIHNLTFIFSSSLPFVIIGLPYLLVGFNIWKRNVFLDLSLIIVLLVEILGILNIMEVYAVGAISMPLAYILFPLIPILLIIGIGIAIYQKVKYKNN